MKCTMSSLRYLKKLGLEKDTMNEQSTVRKNNEQSVKGNTCKKIPATQFLVRLVSLLGFLLLLVLVLVLLVFLVLLLVLLVGCHFVVA